MIWLILAALVAATLTIRAVRRARAMPEWMAQADEEIHGQDQERIIRHRALGDRLGDRS